MFEVKAFCFYFGRFIWVRWEGGTMEYFDKAMNSNKDWTDQQRAETAAEILFERTNKGWNKSYALG